MSNLSDQLHTIYQQALLIIKGANEKQTILNGSEDDLVIIADTEYTDNDELWPIRIEGENVICQGVDSGEVETLNVLELDLWNLIYLADHITKINQ